MLPWPNNTLFFHLSGNSLVFLEKPQKSPQKILEKGHVIRFQWLGNPVIHHSMYMFGKIQSKIVCLLCHFILRHEELVRSARKWFLNLEI